MKFAAVIDYGADRDAVKAGFAEHRAYFRSLLESGQLLAAGPMAEEKGAIWIFQAETPEDAERVVAGDPYYPAGVFVKWQILPLAYWSAKDANAG